ncbi:acVLRF1 family peptidyl-tRNA hydrolase [Nakamurella sp. A5-74]|uniref:AcVLRF1 family peptidyl-tRNA hydrolase n=1 Tax=Nakamurella sp. A5-74 TaxID=3158264 RepID=A0AAU8DJ96_9ACTN
MATRSRPAPGGGRMVDVAPDRLTGWVNRFVAGHAGATEPRVVDDGVLIRAGDGSTASIEVPYPPLRLAGMEPLEAVLAHLEGIGTIGLLLFRAGAHSVGLCKDRTVLASSTDRHYVQGRTAAGGWSQQRYARRRGNQLSAAQQEAASDAARVWSTVTPDVLLLAGDRKAINGVLEDPRLTRFLDLPTRAIGDVPEPRRSVLDDVAARSLDVTVVIRDPG